jgi:hypothetical protein
MTGIIRRSAPAPEPAPIVVIERRSAPDWPSAPIALDDEGTAYRGPADAATIDAMTRLLERLSRFQAQGAPIVLHGPEAYPASASQAAPATHPGIDVRVPAPPVAVAVAKPKERNGWPIVFMASACTAIGSCLVTAVTSDLISLVVTLTAFAVWGVATYQIVFKEQ